MSKKILITCTDSMMKQFLEPHVNALLARGHQVDLACSEVLNRYAELQADFGDRVSLRRVDVRRNPFTPSNLKGFRQLRRIIDEGGYDLIWTNEPAMGVITRLAARRARAGGTRVMYLVHGFHFFRGAPTLNWALYYPIECFMARFADLICTINREDYARASQMKVPETAYIHGIGVDVSRLRADESLPALRRELSLPDSAFLVLSVGELNKNKNQQVVVRALAQAKLPDTHLVLCGRGDRREALGQLAQSLGVSDRVHFLGYRRDMANIYSQCDVFVLPSLREGLGLASLEAMTFGLPVIGADVGGIRDYVKDGVTGILCRQNRPEEYAAAILRLKNALGQSGKRAAMAENCRAVARDFLIDPVREELQAVVGRLL